MDADILSSLLGSLSDEDIESLKDIANSFLSDNEKQEKAEPEQSTNDSGIDIEKLTKIMSLAGSLNSSGDERTALLHSLKPFLSAERRKKADDAAKMMKIIELLPMIKGILGTL